MPTTARRCAGSSATPHPTVAILDSTRAGETFEGIPIVGRVADALCYAPTTALVGVAPTGGTLPAVWRELFKSCISNGLDLEAGMHTFLADDPELVEHARRHSVEPGTSGGRPRVSPCRRREPAARRDRRP